MFGQTTLGKAALSDAANRMFRLEVAGLKQSETSDRLSYAIRRSGSVFLTVSYNRLNDEMQRINRLGGTILSVTPV